ncbi:MAG: hypothetical protein R3A11_05965 [Bdellovibrionota bacterium]
MEQTTQLNVNGISGVFFVFGLSYFIANFLQVASSKTICTKFLG